MSFPFNVGFTTLIDFLGGFTFAISGIRLASGKNIDWYGAYIIGLVTAIGGGTTRDVLLGVTPFWMLDARYIIITGVALLAAILFKDKIFKWGNTLFLFDSIGLGLYTIVGIVKTLDAGFPFWVSIIMGTITGSVGGVIRDIILNEVPLLFRKDLYAVACIMGGIVFYGGLKCQLSMPVAQIVAVSSIIIMRILAVKFKWQLPILRIANEE